MREFNVGDKVYTVQEEVDLFHTRQVGRVHHWVTDFRVAVDLETGGAIRINADELSLIPEGDMRVRILPGPTAFNAAPIFAKFEAGVLKVNDQVTQCRQDLILERWKLCYLNVKAPRRQCDILSADGVMVCEGDLVRRVVVARAPVTAVVLWDYDAAGWSLHEVTPDRFRTGVVWNLAPKSDFGTIVGNVWAVPPMEKGIPEYATVIPSYKIIKARKS
jgi:hypothetical protein